VIPASFIYHSPTSLQELLSLLRDHPAESKVVAGGHSLIPAMKLRLMQPEHLIDLRRVDNLKFISEDAGDLRIGSMTTYAELQRSPVIQGYAPVLSEAAGLVGDVQVRNLGTIGGSLAHADPAADLPAALLALEAKVYLSGGVRKRNISLDRFFVDSFTTVMEETEVITEVRVPIARLATRSAYLKFANRASRFAIVGVAASITLNENVFSRVRIGVTGAGNKPMRLRSVENKLRGKNVIEATIMRAAKFASKGMELQVDIHGSAEYRAHLAETLTFRAIMESLNRADRISG
jgi:carbon-monoxide dehydrogenase medium subunit